MRVIKQERYIAAVLSLAAVSLVTYPLQAHAATGTSSTTVSATIAPTISISTTGPVGISLIPTTGGVVSSASDTVTVNTNNTGGYTLSLSDADAATSLTSSGSTITAHGGTQTTPTALAANTWGYRVVGAGNFGAAAYSAESNNVSSNSTWSGLPTSASSNTIKTTGSPAANDTTTVWYGAKVTTAKPSGSYSDIVTYTAVTN